MLQSTFTQKFFMAVFMGFAAACMFYMFRHIVHQAMWESSEGWKKSLYQQGDAPPSTR